MSQGPQLTNANVEPKTVKSDAAQAQVACPPNAKRVRVDAVPSQDPDINLLHLDRLLLTLMGSGSSTNMENIGKRIDGCGAAVVDATERVSDLIRHSPLLEHHTVVTGKIL